MINTSANRGTELLLPPASPVRQDVVAKNWRVVYRAGSEIRASTHTFVAEKSHAEVESWARKKFGEVIALFPEDFECASWAAIHRYASGWPYACGRVEFPHALASQVADEEARRLFPKSNEIVVYPS